MKRKHKAHMTAGFNKSVDPARSPSVTGWLSFSRKAVVSLGHARSVVAAIVAGAFAVLALPPLYVLPALLVSFPVLLWLLEGSHTIARAFAIGWWFGLGYFVAGLYWVSFSFLVEAELYGWLAIPAVFGLSALLAFFPGLALAGARALNGRGVGAVLGLATCWTIGEWLRGHVLTGFPWNLIGYVWSVSDATMQVAAVIGAYGLSFVTVVIATLPALLAEPKAGRRTRWWPAAASALAVAALWSGGQARLATAHLEDVPDVHLRLVQGNVPQALKWAPGVRERILQRYLHLSQSRGGGPVTHLIWPETALPYVLADGTDSLPGLAEAVPPNGLLLTGSLRLERAAEEADSDVMNSLFAVSEGGEVAAIYDKVHLVPFGEYLPLRWLLPAGVMAGRLDLLAGEERSTFALDGLPRFSPLICYEVIFPGDVTGEGARPRWLLNLTNDAWFGTSAGPYQHFAMARMRAVEEGLPLVRAANTGISAVVDPYGRVLASLGLGETGALDSGLPRPLDRLTLFTRHGDAILLILLAVGLAIALASRPRGRGS